MWNQKWLPSVCFSFWKIQSNLSLTGVISLTDASEPSSCESKRQSKSVGVMYSTHFCILCTSVAPFLSLVMFSVQTPWRLSPSVGHSIILPTSSGLRVSPSERDRDSEASICPCWLLHRYMKTFLFTYEKKKTAPFKQWHIFHLKVHGNTCHKVWNIINHLLNQNP